MGLGFRGDIAHSTVDGEGELNVINVVLGWGGSGNPHVGVGDFRVNSVDSASWVESSSVDSLVKSGVNISA